MITIVFIIIAIFLCFLFIEIYFEYKNFNNGKCPQCGTELHHFDSDSYEARGYCCNTCYYTTWVSYKIIDKYGK